MTEGALTVTEDTTWPKLTERQMLDRLRIRYGHAAGNGVRYAVAEHVRSAAGFDATRTADCIAMDLWPSGGLTLHGHEVKISRSDWLTELRDPSKAEEFKRYMDRWWLVVSDPRIIRPGELPDGWGLLCPSSPGSNLLTTRVQAGQLDPEPVPKTLLACLLRATAKTAVRGCPNHRL